MVFTVDPRGDSVKEREETKPPPQPHSEAEMPAGTQPVQEHASKTAHRSGLWSLLLPENLLLSRQIIILH